jgi:hypothetical protein
MKVEIRTLNDDLAVILPDELVTRWIGTPEISSR